MSPSSCTGPSLWVVTWARRGGEAKQKVGNGTAGGVPGQDWDWERVRARTGKQDPRVPNFDQSREVGALRVCQGSELMVVPGCHLE